MKTLPLLLAISMICSAKAVELVNKGTAVSEIVLSPTASPSVQTAAQQLQINLELISGAKIPIVETATDAAKNQIYVGESEATKKLGFSLEGVKDDGFKIVAEKNYLIVAGREFDLFTTSFSKFKGADHIFHRILWDKKMLKEEFTIGFEDRFLGILEIPFLEFAQKGDLPSHRIKFFKRNGELVWDRTLKINKGNSKRK